MIAQIRVRRPFVKFNERWHPFWDICGVDDPGGGLVIVLYVSAGNKGEYVDAPLEDVLAAIAEASGHA